MAYDEALAERIDARLGMRKDVSTRKMFGGIAWMLDGNMFVGIVKDELMVRVGKDAEASLLESRAARPMDFTGRPMRGYLFVGAEGTQDDEALETWLGHAERFVRTLPPK